MKLEQVLSWIEMPFLLRLEFMDPTIADALFAGLINRAKELENHFAPRNV